MLLFKEDTILNDEKKNQCKIWIIPIPPSPPPTHTHLTVLLYDDCKWIKRAMGFAPAFRYTIVTTKSQHVPKSCYLSVHLILQVEHDHFGPF